MGRRGFATALKVAITIGLVAWLAVRIDVAIAAERLLTMSPGWAIAALIVMFLQLSLAAWRWALVARRLETPLDAAAIIRLSAIGQFFNQTLPSAIGGDAVRAWLAGRLRPPMGRAISAVIVDRLVALLVLLLLIAITLPIFFARVDDIAARQGAAIAGAGGALGFVALLALGDALAGWLARRRWGGFSAMILADLRAASVGGRAGAPVVALSFAVHVQVAAVIYLLARGLGLDIAALDCLILVPPVILFTMLPVSLAGWGVREGAMVVGFGLVGIAATDALALSVAFGLVNAATGLPGGVLWLIGKNRLPPAGTLAGEASGGVK